MPHRRPSKKNSSVAAKALSYTNRQGVTYYLHAGTTKTGKPRYFVAKTIRAGALAKMPDGREFSESINGVVSVRKVRVNTPKIPDTDLVRVRAELDRHPHLRHHRVDSRTGEIIVYEPIGVLASNVVARLASAMYMRPENLESRLARDKSRTRYDPVMKLVRQEPGLYSVHRMTYRGDGGWSWPLASGPLSKLVKKYIKHVGTEEFFELL